MQLQIQSGQNAGQTFQLVSGTTTIGRSAENNVVLGDPTVSRRHARIDQQGNAFVISDLRSTSGTWLNGNRLTSPQWLREGDTIMFGQTAAVALASEAIPMAPMQPTAYAAPQPAAQNASPILMLTLIAMLVGLGIFVLLLIFALRSPASQSQVAALPATGTLARSSTTALTITALPTPTPSATSQKPTTAPTPSLTPTLTLSPIPMPSATKTVTLSRKDLLTRVTWRPSRVVDSKGTVTFMPEETANATINFRADGTYTTNNTYNGQTINGKWELRNNDTQFYDSAGNGSVVDILELSSSAFRIKDSKGGTEIVLVPASPTLTVPQQLSPSNGAMFSIFPRTTTLQWSPVAGASKYMVQIDCQDCCQGGKWCSDVGGDARVIEVKGTSYTFDWVGAQKGRWRVWGIDESGEGPKTGWWVFEYTE